MTYELIIEIALKSFVTSGLALLLLALLKDRSAGERSWIAHIGLVATLALPLAAIFMPKWYVESPAPPVESTAREAAPAGIAGNAPAAAPVDPHFAIDFGSIAFWFYALVAAALLLVTLLAVVRLFMLRARASVLVEPKWLSALAHAQRRMGFKHGTALLVSDALGSPVSWGVLRPIILLNEEAVSSEAEAEAIIAHELAHVAHLDWAKLLVARAATALFWFNPLVWLLARQCHQLREEAADDAVLLSDVPSTDYAALLIGAARHDSKGALLAANGVAPGRGSLKRRVTRVLDAKLQRRPARMRWGAACTLAGLAVAAPLAAVTAVAPPESFTHQFVSAPARPMPLSVVAEAAANSAQAVASAALAGAAVATAPSAAPSAAPAAPELTVATAAPAPLAPVASSPQAAPSAAQAKAAPAALEAMVGGAVTAALSQVTQDLGADLLVQARAPVPERQAPKPSSDARPFQLTPEQLVSMRVHRLSADYIRKLAEAGYPNLSYKELMNAGIHGVTPEYIGEISRAGYPGLTMSQLTSMRIHRVTPAFIQGLAQAGYPGLGYNELINAAVHRVTPEFIREMAAAGYSGLTMKQLTAMRIHRISPSFIQEMRSIGRERLPSGQLIEPEAQETKRTEGATERKLALKRQLPVPRAAPEPLPLR